MFRQKKVTLNDLLLNNSILGKRSIEESNASSPITPKASPTNQPKSSPTSFNKTPNASPVPKSSPTNKTPKSSPTNIPKSSPTFKKPKSSSPTKFLDDPEQRKISDMLSMIVKSSVASAIPEENKKTIEYSRPAYLVDLPKEDIKYNAFGAHTITTKSNHRSEALLKAAINPTPISSSSLTVHQLLQSPKKSNPVTSNKPPPPSPKKEIDYSSIRSHTDALALEYLIKVKDSTFRQPLSPSYQLIVENFHILESLFLLNKESVNFNYVSASIEKKTGKPFKLHDLGSIISIFPEGYEYKSLLINNKPEIVIKSRNNESLLDILKNFQPSIESRRSIVFESRLYSKIFKLLLEQCSQNDTFMINISKYNLEGIVWPISIKENVIFADKLPFIQPIEFSMASKKEIINNSIKSFVRRSEEDLIINSGIKLRTEFCSLNVSEKDAFVETKLQELNESDGLAIEGVDDELLEDEITHICTDNIEKEARRLSISMIVPLLLKKAEKFRDDKINGEIIRHDIRACYNGLKLIDRINSIFTSSSTGLSNSMSYDTFMPKLTADLGLTDIHIKSALELIRKRVPFYCELKIPDPKDPASKYMKSTFHVYHGKDKINYENAKSELKIEVDRLKGVLTENHCYF